MKALLKYLVGLHLGQEIGSRKFSDLINFFLLMYTRVHINTDTHICAHASLM